METSTSTTTNLSKHTVSSHPFMGHPREDPGSIFFTPSHQVFLYFDNITLNLLFWLNSPRFLRLSSHDRCPSPLIIFMDLLLYVHVYPALGSPELDTEGSIPSLNW